MSIKDLFKDIKAVSNLKSEEILTEVESKDFISAKTEEIAEFIPNIDFSDPKNFAKFGSASEYYKQAVSHIYTTYPYDGSEKEMVEWKNKLTYLEKYVFNEKYPQVTGYVQLNSGSYATSSEYVIGAGTDDINSKSNLLYKPVQPHQSILVYSGPNSGGALYKASSEALADPYSDSIVIEVSGAVAGNDIYRDGNVYNSNTKQLGNLFLDATEGNTVEFWFKVNEDFQKLTWVPNYAPLFSLVDIWNGQPLEISGVEGDVSNPDYSRLLVDLSLDSESSSSITVTYQSGHYGCERQLLDLGLTATQMKQWHHYSVSVKNVDDSIEVSLYVDGILKQTVLSGERIDATFNNVGIKASIGSYQLAPTFINQITFPHDHSAVIVDFNNAGCVPGSFDEFRFWKICRTHENISRYRFDRVYGGTNNDIVNTNLGVYYRFNEVSMGDDRDGVVLDYSGRISNAVIVNYMSGVRCTGSAIDDSAQFTNKALEPKEPVLYSGYADVLSLAEELQTLGSQWDESNSNSIYRSMPDWITEEDSETTEELKSLTQIIASYFDKAYLQIKNLPAVHTDGYYGDDSKPSSFTKTMLDSSGFIAPDIFVDSSLIEDLKKRGEDRLLEKDLADLKNLIYRNIYNNLAYIYKSKGTEKSFRNLIRSFGVDDELVKMNVYANNTEFAYEDTTKNTVVSKNVVDLSRPETFSSTIYNTIETPGSASDVSSYLLPTLNASSSKIPYQIVPTTLQVELVFPKKLQSDYGDVVSDTGDDIKIALFGGSKVANPSSQEDYTVDDIAEHYNFDVYFVKNNKFDNGGYFEFDCRITGEIITSSYIADVYGGNKWNFAVRTISPFTNLSQLSGTASAVFEQQPGMVAYAVAELYAINVVDGQIKQEISLVSRIQSPDIAKNIHADSKRIYVGAKRENITGSLIYNTDALVSHVRFWYDEITNEEILRHARNITNKGVTTPLEKPYQVVGEYIERMNLLAFDWSFDELTTTDSTGSALFKDSKLVSDTRGSVFQLNLGQNYPAKLQSYAANNTNIARKYYELSAKQVVAENLYSSDSININGDDSEVFTRDTRPQNTFIAFEKSMYQTVSEEMLNMFSGIADFNNLIGAPINKYRQDYRDLGAIRAKFFKKINNEPALEKYLEYYKWIDSAIGDALSQIVPVGADFSRNVRNMVESHVLERSKYDYKLPQFSKDQPNYGQLKGIKELKYNWQSGHAGGDLWLKERAERENSAFIVSAGNADIDAQKQQILDSIVNETNKPAYKVFDTKTSTVYDKSTYSDRKLARLYDLEADKHQDFSDDVSLYSIENIKDLADGAREIRPVFSGSDYARQSRFNEKQANFSAGYEVIQAPGREVNNKFFVEAEGRISGSNTIPFIHGREEFTLQDRGSNKTVMVSRFSSPGGSESLSRGALDRDSETFSVYNTINHRNPAVRSALNTWSKNTSSVENSSSLHKVNKNHLRSALSDKYDNDFVQHQMPRTDYSYSWVKAAMTGTVSGSGAYVTINPNNTAGELSVITASMDSAELIDFVGIGINSNPGTQISLDISTSTLTFTTTGSAGLHRFNLINTGPFGYASWKNTNCKDNNKLLRSLVKNNKFVIQKNIVRSTLFGAGKAKAYTITNAYVEPPVEWNMPLVYGISATTNKKTKHSMDLGVEFSNDIDTIANPLLKNYMGGIPKKTKESLTYWKLKEILEKENSGYEIKQITKSEIIFPRKENIGLGIIRTKPNYAEEPGTGSNGYSKNSAEIRTFWRDLKSNRIRTTSSTDISFNCLNLPFKAATLPTASDDNVALGCYRPEYVSTTSERFNYTRDLQAYTKDSSLVTDCRDAHNTTITTTPTNNIVSFATSTYGDLFACNELNNRYLTRKQGGIYTADAWESVSVGQNERLTFIAKHTRDNSVFNARPSPQLFFINHYPSYNFYATSSDGVNSTGKLFVLNNGASYKTDILSNNKPWFDSYEEFSKDIRPMSVKFTQIPEYKISEHMEYYVKENKGNFDALPPQDYLSLDGVSINYNDIHSGINSSDDFNKFLVSDELLGAQSQKIKIKINAIKKLLPYKGFYPSDRSVQVVDIFGKSFFGLSAEEILSSSITSPNNKDDLATAGSTFNQQVASIIQPLFAPGVLYNTIKSNIAVDYPTYVSSTAQYSGSIPEYYSTGSTAEPVSSRNMSFAVSKYNNRVQFEDLLNIKNAFSNEMKLSGSQCYLNPTYYGKDTDKISYDIDDKTNNKYCFPSYVLENKYSSFNSLWDTKDDLYKLAIHNYLAEIPSFFLKGAKLSSFSSKPQSKLNLQVNSGTAYFMDVYLQRDLNYRQVLDVIPDSGSYMNGVMNNIFKVNMYAASTFGPPTQNYGAYSFNPDAASNIADACISYYNLYNSYKYYYGRMFETAFAPYVPSYYYGKEIARLKYVADSDTEASLHEIIRKAQIEYINLETIDAFKDNSLIFRNYRTDPNSPTAENPTASLVWTGPAYPTDYLNSPAYLNRMKISASVNFKQTSTGKKLVHGKNNLVAEIHDAADDSENTWTIQTKFETPAINFNTALNTENTGTLIQTTFSDNNKSSDSTIIFETLGIWTGYGEVPQSGKGIRFGIEESFAKENRQTNTGSLIELCGFETGQTDIGSIANAKEISEAVVLIPYIGGELANFNSDVFANNIPAIVGENGATADTVYSKNNEFYFEIDRERMKDSLGQDFDFASTKIDQLKKIISNSAVDSNNSIIKCMRGMLDYNIPPHLDWVTNKNINPFVMYVLEFKHTLDQQDLSDIWQGVMPKIAKTAQLDTAVIEHANAVSEMFHGKTVPPGVRFKIFKVKKKAAMNYYELTEDSSDDTRFKFKFANKNGGTPNYSYNWPYDFFSLVELINVEATETFTPIKPDKSGG